MIFPHNTQQDTSENPGQAPVTSLVHIWTPIMRARLCRQQTVQSEAHGQHLQNAHKGAFVSLPPLPHICRDVKSRGFTGKPLCCVNMGIVPVHAWLRLGKGTNAACP